MRRPRESHADKLLTTCEALLRELSDYSITPERLIAATPLIDEIHVAIRMLDEVDVSRVEPVTVFRPSPC
jgi:hypothetical protein